MIRVTATPHAPWYVIPADNRWFALLAVTSVVVDAIERLGLALPDVGPELQEQLLSARVMLENEQALIGRAGRETKQGTRP